MAKTKAPSKAKPAAAVSSKSEKPEDPSCSRCGSFKVYYTSHTDTKGNPARVIHCRICEFRTAA